jgi:hypothetical protein
MAFDLDFADLLFAPQYEIFGVALTFKHPKTRASVQLQAIDNTLRSESNGTIKVMVASRKPQYCVRMEDLAALNLSATDLDGLAVSVDGKNWTVDSSAIFPGPSFGTGEVALNLIAPK